MSEENRKERSHWPLSVLSTLPGIVNLALPLILVRTISPAEFGQFKIFFLYIFLLSDFALTAGLVNGIAYWSGQGKLARPALKLTTFTIAISSALMLVIAFLMRDFIALHFGWPMVYGVMFALSLGASVASNFFEEIAIARGRIWTGALFYSGFEILRSIGIIIVVLWTADLSLILLTHTIVQLIKVGVSFFMAARLGVIGLEFDRNIVKGVYNYGVPVSVSALFGVFMDKADQVVLSNVISTEQFAFYAAGCLLLPPLLTIEQSVARVMIPQVADYFYKGKTVEAAGLYRGAVKTLAFLFLPAMTGLMLFSDPIVEILYTSEYLKSAGYLKWFALYYGMIIFPWDALPRARGEGWWQLRARIVFSIIAVGLVLILASSYGVYGALSGFLFSEAARRVYGLLYIKGTTEWGFKDFIPLPDIFRYGGVCIGLALLCLVCKSLFSSQIWWFIVCGGAFSALYFPLILLVKNITDRHVRDCPHVLVLSQTLYVGGLEKVILALCTRMSQLGSADVRVFAYDHDSSNDAQTLVPRFESAGIGYDLYKKPYRFSIMVVVKILQIILRNDIRVVHCHDLGGVMYATVAKILSLGRIRILYTQHSFLHLGIKSRYRIYEKLFSFFVDECTVVSEDTLKGFGELGISTKGIQLIENGIPVEDRPVRDRNEKIQLRKELLEDFPDFAESLGSNIEDHWCLYLARVHPGKGQNQVFKIWQELEPSIRKQMLLLFVGPESSQEVLDSLLAEASLLPDQERILFLGSTSFPSKWNRVADVFLSSSEFEGMPLAPLEAAAGGVPLLLSQIPGHEFLEDVGRLYPLEDPSQGALALKEILSEIENGVSEYYINLWNKSETLREHYSLDNMVKAYLSLYQKMESKFLRT